MSDEPAIPEEALAHAVLLLIDRTRELAEARAERDKAQANYQFMVNRAADEKLDGYRELGARAAAAENSRDDAIRRAEQAERVNAALRAAVLEARRVFRMYALLHSAKGTPEGQAKSAENERMADSMDAVLALAEPAAEEAGK